MRRFLVASLLLLPTVCFAQWQPPIGIPAPSFGIIESAPNSPNPWTSDTPGFYYVDQANPLATDSPTTRVGNPTRPRKTIPFVLPAGAVVEVHGTYGSDHHGGWAIRCVGTVTAPCWIRGVDTANRPTFTNFFNFSGSYTIVENIKFALAPAGKGGFIFYPNTTNSDHLVLRHSEVTGTLQGGGIQVYTPTNQAGKWITDVVFWDNYIHHNGDALLSTVDQDMHGITVNGLTSRMWVIDNELSFNSGNGIQINGGTGVGGNDRITFMYVGRNSAHDNKQSGLWTKEATDVIFSQNVSYNAHRTATNTGGCFGEQYGPQRVWWIYNIGYACEIGFRASTDIQTEHYVTDTYYLDNLVYNIHILPQYTYRLNNAYDQSAFNFVGDGTVTRHVIDNTAWDIDAGVNMASPIGATALIVAGNVFGNVAPNRGLHINNYVLAAAQKGQVGKNYFQGVGGYEWGSSTVRTLAGLQSAFPGQCVGCFEGDGYLDTAQYVPIYGGPLYNGGIPTAPEYQLFQQLYGLDITGVDVYKNSRTVAGARDLGAVELQAVPPLAPLGTVVAMVAPTVTWTAPVGGFPATGIRVERQLDALGFTTAATLAPDATSFTDTAQPLGSNVDYRVFYFNAVGDSPASDVVSVINPK